MSTLIFFIIAMTGVLITATALARQKPYRKSNHHQYSRILAIGFGLTTMSAYFTSLFAGGVNFLHNKGLIYLGIFNAVVLGFVVYIVGLYWFGRNAS